MLRRVVALAIGLSLAAPADARDHYYYYKAHVARAAYQADREECLRLMGGTRTSRPVFTAYGGTPAANAAAAGIATLFAGMMASAEHRKKVSAVERTCMADKGYGRYSVEDKLAGEIEDLPRAEDRLERYFAMATAASPTGERMVE